MAEPAPMQTGSPDPLVYRPVSGMAILGLTLAGVYAVLVIISTAVALIQGIPFFLSGWFLILVISAATVSYLALRKIQDSEGTLAGASLARVGLWMSIFTGLGYTAYANVTGLALRQQAHIFLTEKSPESGFFPRLQDRSPKEFNAAFLLTLPPQSRTRLDPEDETKIRLLQDQRGKGGEKGNFSSFKENILVKLISRASKIEPAGLQDWKFENRSYQVNRNYKLVVPEAEVEFVLPVFSSEGTESGEQRKWFVNLPQAHLTKITRTPLGANLLGARYVARQFLTKWQAHINSGKSFQLFKSHDLTDWVKLESNEAIRKVVRDKVEHLFTSSDADRLFFQFNMMMEEFFPWQEEKGKLRVGHFFKLRIPNAYDGKDYQLEGWVYTQSKEKINLENVRSPAWEDPYFEFIDLGPFVQDGPG
jgi:hypothetical protein